MHVKCLLVIAAAVAVCWSTASAVGPFEIVAPDSTVLRLQLAAQLQSAWESKDKGSGVERDESVYMKARRIRPTLSVTVPEYKTSFRLHLSTAPGSIELMDLYFDTKLKRNLTVRAGQYKIPFTRYRIQSFQRLTFVDWSIVTKYFGAERQLGIAVHNGYEKAPALAYAAGLFSGVNARSSHAVGLASIFGEPVSNPSDLSAASARSEFHPEFVAHVSYNANGIDVSTDSDADGGGVRYSFAISAAWDIDPAVYQDLALRLSPEYLIKYRHFALMGAAFIGFVDINGTQRTRSAMTGALLQGAWRVNRRFELAARYADVDIDAAVADASLARAAAIMDGSDDDDTVNQYKDAGKVRGEREGTVAVTIYLDEHNLKVQNDAGFTVRDRIDHDRTDYLVRSQIQLSF